MTDMKRYFTYILFFLSLWFDVNSTPTGPVNVSAPVNMAPGKTPLSTEGNPRIPFILVEFSDVPFMVESPEEFYDSALNGSKFNRYNATGSLREWFTANSLGCYVPEFEIIGPVKATKPSVYYGMNNAYGQDANTRELIQEVLRKTGESADMSIYDNDGDGVIDFTFICYAGQGESTYGDSYTIRPVNGSLSDSTHLPVTIGNVKADRYAMTNEWDLIQPTGTGTFLYQYLLACGLPTLSEPYTRIEASSPQSWDLMDTGYLNNSGFTPPNLSALERMTLGWLEPKILSTSGKITLMDLGSSNEAIKIEAGNDGNEYFLLEYRKQMGWDEYLPNHGLLIWHVDYDPEAWASGTVNEDGSHHRVRLIKPNCIDVVPLYGTAHLTVLPGWCFPGSEGVTEISNRTVPAFRNWEGDAVPLPLSSIKESTTRTSVSFIAGDEPELKVPVANVPENSQLGEDWFIASWNDIEGIDDYVVSLYKGTRQTIGSMKCDFGEGSNVTMPYGWDSTSGLAYSSTTNFGENAPALRLRDEGSYLMSRAAPEAINSFTFWARNVSAEKAMLIITGRDLRNGAYSIAEIPISDIGTIYEIKDIPAQKDIRRIKFLFERLSGSISIDDITINYGAEPTLYPGYEHISVHGNTSVRIDNLPRDESYYYTVRSVYDGEMSEESAPVEVMLMSSVVTLSPSSFHYTLDGTHLKSDSPMTIYTINGTQIGRVDTEEEFDLPGTGMYIIRWESADGIPLGTEKIIVGVK